MSAFVVDGHAEGVSSETLRTMGMPGWQLGAPRFEDVEQAADREAMWPECIPGAEGLAEGRGAGGQAKEVGAPA